MKKKLLIYYPAQYPANVSPAQRFRLEQYFPYLEKDNIVIYLEPFIDDAAYSIIFSKGYFTKKIFGIIKGFFRRTLSLFMLFKYDLIFINREACPLGPPVFEWLYVKVFRKKILYDIDDAVWLQTTSEMNKIAQKFRCIWKFNYIIKWSSAVIGGNEYLCAYAKKFNSNVHHIPTSVDTISRYNLQANQHVEKITIGWTGSFSTMEFLTPLIKVLEKLSSTYDFNVLIISNAEPNFTLPNLEYIPWSEAVEVEALAKCQIGCMPMKKDEWSLGKCGFKIIQYMALGIVPVADNWGANNDIIQHNHNGILVSDTSKWEQAIVSLINDVEKRTKLSNAAKQTAHLKYSTSANYPKLLQLLRELAT